MTGIFILDLFLVVATAAILVMVLLATYGSRSPVAQEVVSARGYAIRRYWFFTVLVAAIAVFIYTIPHFPYGSAQSLGRHYQVIAQQYSFMLPASIPVDTPVVFNVTSRDVNHGFAIYDPTGRLVVQVQAMPSYVNHLPFVFHVRGHYTVRCLEYCGLAHAAMQGGFEVR